MIEGVGLLVPGPIVLVLMIGLLVLFVTLTISIPRIVVGGGLVPLVLILMVVMGVVSGGRFDVVVVAIVSGVRRVVGRSAKIR